MQTLKLPTTSSSALGLALASSRSFRAFLRFLRRLLRFFPSCKFPPFYPALFPTGVRISLRPPSPCPVLANALGVAVQCAPTSTSSLITPKWLLGHSGPGLSSPFATKSILSATMTQHLFRRQNSRVENNCDIPSRCVAGHHGRLDHVRPLL